MATTREHADAATFEVGKPVVGIMTRNHGRPSVYAADLTVTRLTQTRIIATGKDGVERAYRRSDLEEVGTGTSGYEPQRYVIEHRGSDLHLAARKAMRRRRADAVVNEAIKALNDHRMAGSSAYNRATVDQDDAAFRACLVALRKAADDAVRRMDVRVEIFPPHTIKES